MSTKTRRGNYYDEYVDEPSNHELADRIFRWTIAAVLIVTAAFVVINLLSGIYLDLGLAPAPVE